MPIAWYAEKVNLDWIAISYIWQPSYYLLRSLIFDSFGDKCENDLDSNGYTKAMGLKVLNPHANCHCLGGIITQNIRIFANVVSLWRRELFSGCNIG